MEIEMNEEHKKLLESIADLKEVTVEGLTVRVSLTDQMSYDDHPDLNYYRVNLGHHIDYEGETFFQCLSGFSYPVQTEQYRQAYVQILNMIQNKQLTEDSRLTDGLEWDTYEMFVLQHSSLFVDSHYRYLDEMLNPFWKEVFGKSANELFCGGIVSAHGDKAYGYKNEWAKAGINKYRGTLLFLLSYTKERGETPRHEVEQWVIDNYPKYLPMIEVAEKQIMDRILQKAAAPVNITIDSREQNE